MSDTHGGHAVEHHEHPPVPYFKIFGTLIVFTVVTIAASYIKPDQIPGGKMGAVALGLLIAGFKGSLVMIFFMHLKYERRPIVVIALIPFVLAFVLLFALFPDVVNGEYHQNQVVETKTEK